jgi:hypothetical protein
MSEQIDRLFSKFNDDFKGRQEEIKNHLNRYFKKDFKERILDKVDVIDATEKIETSGFRNNISSWKDSYGNIFITTCLIENGIEKRYDYKISFVKSKFLSEDIEEIERAMKEISSLRDNLQLRIAVLRLDSATKLAKEMKISKYLGELRQVEEEVKIIEKDYNLQLDELVRSIETNRVKNIVDGALDDCKKVVEISNSIDKNKLLEKYEHITERIMNEMLVDKKNREDLIQELEETQIKLKDNRKDKNYDQAMKNCKRIIYISKNLERKELVDDYEKILDDLKNEEASFNERKRQLRKQLREYDEKVKKLLEYEQLEEALELNGKCIQLSREFQDDDLTEKYEFIKKKIQNRLEQKAIDEKFNNLKKTIEQLNEEGLSALNDNKLDESLKKYKQIKEYLVNYSN